MKIFFKNILVFLIVITTYTETNANQYCECISYATFPTPNGDLHYVAKCYVKGKEREVLESIHVKDVKTAKAKTEYLKKQYKIPTDACVTLPNGDVVYSPHSSF